MKTKTEIRVALTNAFKSIKSVKGYSRDLPDAHFKTNYAAVNKQEDWSKYPKIFTTVGDIAPTTEVARRKKYTVTYYYTIVVLQAERGVNVEPIEQLEALSDDVEKMLLANSTLGGLVHTIDLVSISMDSGFIHPEGIAIFELRVEYYDQF